MTRIKDQIAELDALVKSAAADVWGGDSYDTLCSALVRAWSLWLHAL